MRRIAPVLIALPLLAAASAPVQPAGIPLDTALQQARAEQSAAEAEATKLERVAAQAQGEAERLRAEQAAAAQNIEAAEARITAADAMDVDAVNAMRQPAGVDVEAHSPGRLP